MKGHNLEVRRKINSRLEVVTLWEVNTDQGLRIADIEICYAKLQSLHK